MWSISLRFFSSGTRQSKQRLPASMWKIGTSCRAAATAERPLLVSPSTSSASGRNAEQLGLAACDDLADLLADVVCLDAEVGVRLGQPELLEEDRPTGAAS